jgi:hypothetical protein
VSVPTRKPALTLTKAPAREHPVAPAATVVEQPAPDPVAAPGPEPQPAPVEAPPAGMGMLSVRLDLALRKEIKQYAVAHDVKVQAVIDEALREYLVKHA